MSFTRVGGVAAVCFAVTILLSNVLILIPAGMPTTGAELGAVAEFFSANGEAVILASTVTPASWVFATLFGVGVVAEVWQSERERGEAWSLVGLVGLILQNATFTGVIAVRLALQATVHNGGAIAELWALQEALFSLNGTFLALALIGLSLAGLRNKIIRPSHTAIGLIAATLQFSSATLAPFVMRHGGLLGMLGLVGWLIWTAWIIAYGVTLIRSVPSGNRHSTTA